MDRHPPASFGEDFVASQDFPAAPAGDEQLRRHVLPDVSAAPARPPAELSPSQVLAEVRDALMPQGWIDVALHRAGRALRPHHLPAEHTAGRYVCALVAVAAEFRFARSKGEAGDRDLRRRFRAVESDLEIVASTLETGLNLAERADRLPYSPEQLLAMIGPCYAAAAVHLRLAADTLSGRYLLPHHDVAPS
ncbi:hypothetical protein [Streptomyces sp. NPDC015125]|uniref:hypothetical protein n=1 Tax=Streptomyces sp. NPDC015125 TaxID=3364938 RepID=UPI0036FDE1C9